MQVNFNPSVNQARPQFKALKSIKFEGEALQNCARAQKELLTILDHPNIKKIFQKYDGEVLFKDYQVFKPHHQKKLAYSIYIFDNLSKKFSKIKQEYLEKVKKENLSRDIFEGIKSDEYEPDYSFCHLGRSVTLHYVFDDILEKSKLLSEYAKEELEDPKKNELLDWYIEHNEEMIRSRFASALERALKLQKDNIDEVTAKDDVANKLKELLGE